MAFSGEESIFQSTRPVRGETLLFLRNRPSEYISIHSPRAGRDTTAAISKEAIRYFNPLAPCGARLGDALNDLLDKLFQSTRPVRGETQGAIQALGPVIISIHSPRAGRDLRPGAAPCPLWNFNPLAPCGARHALRQRQIIVHCISIHSPRAGRDQEAQLPAHGGQISIHSPRAGRDPGASPPALATPNFNPLAPCGARRSAWNIWRETKIFQSTRPVRGETPGHAKKIHCMGYFNPLAPCGARHGFINDWLQGINFNPLAPCGARRFLGAIWLALHQYFNPLAPCGARRGGPYENTALFDFNPLAPCGARRSAVRF